MRADMERTITPGVYRHFKGNCYRVDCIATHTETGESMVVYQALYGEHKMFVRPLKLFAGPVDREKYPDADQEYRFELMEEPGATQTWARLIRKRFEQVR